MKRVISELEKLESEFILLRDYAANIDKIYIGLDKKTEGEMEGSKLAYDIAAGLVHDLILSIKGEAIDMTSTCTWKTELCQ